MNSKHERPGRKSVRFEVDAVSHGKTEHFQIYDDSESDLEPPALADESDSEVEHNKFDFDSDDEEERMEKQQWFAKLQQKCKPNTLLLIQQSLFSTSPSLSTPAHRVETDNGQTGSDRTADTAGCGIQRETDNTGTSSSVDSRQRCEDGNHGIEAQERSNGESFELSEGCSTEHSGLPSSAGIQEVVEGGTAFSTSRGAPQHPDRDHEGGKVQGTPNGRCDSGCELHDVDPQRGESQLQPDEQAEDACQAVVCGTDSRRLWRRRGTCQDRGQARGEARAKGSSEEGKSETCRLDGHEQQDPSRDSDLLLRGGGRRERAREEDEELRLRHSHELDGAGREAEASEESSEQNGLSQGFRAKVRRRRKNADESPAKAMQLNELKELFFCDEPASEWEAACRVFLADSQSSKNLVAGEMHHLYNLAANLKLDETVAEPEKCAPCDFGIIEYCCEEDSEVGGIARHLGIDVLRITKDVDCLKKETLTGCLEFIRSHDRVHLHGSVPCTPWSTIQFLNIHMYGLPFQEKLHKARLLSLRQIAVFLILCRAVKEKQGTSSFEWPKNAQGWEKPLVQQLIREICYETTLVDGCSVGVRSKKTGEPILKPWRFETDCETLSKRLVGKRCSRDHKHTPCEGSETAASGRYPKELARLLVKAVFEHHLRQHQQQWQDNRNSELNEAREQLIQLATQEETNAFLELDAKRRRQLLDAARKVHVNTGHKPVAELAKLLRKQNAPLASRAAMEQVRCSSCSEHRRPDVTPAVSLGKESVPFKFLSWDIKEVTDQVNKHKYLIIIDDATRFTRAIKVLSIPKAQHKNVTTHDVLEAFESGWEEIFGLPTELRHDPEGAFVSTEMIEKMSQKGVQVCTTAGEAHWQNGLCERVIQTIFSSAARISSEQGMAVTRAVALATAAHNHLDIVHGFSPSQWALGRSPNWQNLLHEEPEDRVNISRDGHEAFSRKMLEQIQARKIWQEEDLKKKLQRAERAKHRKDRVFIPGELVYAWRLGTNKIAGSKREGLHKGAWFGPATVLGTETKLEHGAATPSNVVWIIISDRLWRCAPQQLRRASEREHSQFLLTQQKPWTFENVSSTLVHGQYRDITEEGFPDEEGGPVQEEVLEEEPPAEPAEDMEDAPEGVPDNRPKRQLERAVGNGQVYRKKSKPDSNLQRAHFLAQECGEYAGEAFFSSADCPTQVLEISFPFIEGDRALRKYLKNPEAFVVTSLKKKRVEVKEKNLNPAEQQMIREAKGKEVREFVKEHVVERVKEGEDIDMNKVMRMRWVLTWKKQEDGTKKGKARLVVLGFEDPFLGAENTSSPTLNKRSKQMLLQIAVQNEWRLSKGDVTAAFLQGRPISQSKYALAPPELAEAMNLPKGERVIKLLKSVYGLTTAPIEWFNKVNDVLREIGFEQCACDPCMWRLVENDKLVGLIGAHVDDFLITGDESLTWKEAMRILLSAFRWTPWEETKFKQCGVTIVQNPDNSITQSQAEYLSTLSEIDMKNERKNQLNSPVTETERTQLRALLGGLQWLVTQTRVDGMVDVNLLQSCVATATVETVLAANKVVRKLRQGPAELYTRRLPTDEKHHLVAWSDASWANRKDGKSTGGFLIGLCGAGVLEGKRGHVTVISWGTNKLKRVAKSSMSAELQALANAEDELHLCRLAWAEFNGFPIDLNEGDKSVEKIPGTIVIDAKSIYDALTSQNQPLQLAEKRTALELLAYLKNTEANKTETRWVHGGANLADGLTKLGAHPMLREFLETSTWSLVYDPAQQAGKKRQAKGLDKLQNENAVDFSDKFEVLAWRKLKAEWPDFCQESDDEQQ